MRSFAVVTLLALTGLSAAQQVYNIDPDTVPKSTRQYWCKQQKSQCPLICLQQPGVTSQNTVANDCDPVRPTVPPTSPPSTDTLPGHPRRLLRL
jgi:hypothetical protein